MLKEVAKNINQKRRREMIKGSNGKVGLMIFLTLILMLVCFASACAPAAKPAEKVKVIKIGSMWDVSGPYASAGVNVRKGFADYISYINDQGGIKRLSEN